MSRKGRKTVAILASAALLTGGGAYLVTQDPLGDLEQKMIQEQFHDPEPFRDEAVKPDPIPTEEPQAPEKGEKGEEQEKAKLAVKNEDGTVKEGTGSAPRFIEPRETITVDDTSTDGSNPGKPVRTNELKPNSVAMPKLNSYTNIDNRYGKVVNGALTVPNSIDFVRWQEGPTLQATEGNIVLAAHINHRKTPGPLKKVNQLRAGDKAYTTDANGVTRAWKLQEVTMSKKANLPKEIFTTKGQNKLVMVTCGGTLLKQGQEYHFDSNAILTFVPSR